MVNISTYAHELKDIQIWLGLRGYYCRNNGCIHLVHCPHDVLAVRSLIYIPTLRVLRSIAEHDFVEMPTRLIMPPPLSPWTPLSILKQSRLFSLIQSSRHILISRQHFNNEAYEASQYDKHLKEYEQSSTKITTSLAYLNSGQNVIFSSALTLTMFLAAQGVVNGK